MRVLGDALSKRGILEGDILIADLCDERDRTRRYQRLPVGEAWGIGQRTTDKLAALGIDTVVRCLAMPQRDARALLTVVGARVQAELRGVSCLPLSLMAAGRKGI